MVMSVMPMRCEICARWLCRGRSSTNDCAGLTPDMAAISRQNRNTRKARRNMGNASFNVRPSNFLQAGRGLWSLVGYLRRAAMPAVSRSTEFKSRAPLCFFGHRRRLPRLRRGKSRLYGRSHTLLLCYISPQTSGGFMRPLGVTLVGLYQILRGVIGVVFGLSILLFAGLAAKLASLAAEGNGVENILHRFGHLAGLGIIVFAVGHMIAGYGVLQMQNWGRLLTLLFSAIGLVLVLPGVFVANVFCLLFGGINAACIFYLAMPPIKRAFHAEGNPARVAA